jgi:hypothetical protein
LSYRDAVVDDGWEPTFEAKALRGPSLVGEAAVIIVINGEVKQMGSLAAALWVMYRVPYETA